MREIKFKAWDTKQKRWRTDYDDVLIDQDGRLQCFVQIGYEGLMQEVKNVEIVLFTGLLDKNGKEIYESDVVRVDDDWDKYGMTAGESYEVYFNEGGFRLKPKYDKNARGYWLEDNNEFEIIGNIYENPELIL